MTRFREASWDEALNAAAEGLRAIRDRDGGGALAGFGFAKCSNEEAYLFQKLVRTGFGTNNLDHCTRLCHASSVAALLEGIGSGAVSAPFGAVQDVVQDIFLTETAFHADVVLPASAWPEQDGTVTNTNRQVQRGRKAVEPPSDARQDWWITNDLAQRMGCRWSFSGPGAVYAEMAGLMTSLKNISWERVSAEGAVTYPCSAPDLPGEEIVFGDGFPTPSVRGKLVGAGIVPPDELPDDLFPMVLTTGRQLEHWHTGAMSRRVAVLDELEPEAVASLSPDEMAWMGIDPGSMVWVATRRGSVELRARADGAVPAGMVFIPFCYAEAPANLLTNQALDPFGKIPELKFCAARVEAL